MIHLTAGPVADVDKEELPAYLDDFVAAWSRTSGSSGPALALLAVGDGGADAARPAPDPDGAHHAHDGEGEERAAGAGQAAEPDVREHGEAEIVASADILTANTADEAAELQRHYQARPEQIAVVPPGVDLHTFHPCDQPKSRAQLGVAQDAEVILFVGRIQPLKAPDTLIKATALLVAARPERRARLRLIIIGSPSGPESAWAKALPDLAADLGISDVVEFRPHSLRAELFRWYCVSDVVGVPSHNESFGLVALEAQACGRPVVATDVGGLRHAVDDGVTGLLVPGTIRLSGRTPSARCWTTRRRHVGWAPPLRYTRPRSAGPTRPPRRCVPTLRPSGLTPAPPRRQRRERPEPTRRVRTERPRP